MATDIVFIVNPAAGHGRAGRRWGAAHALAVKRFPDHKVLHTERQGHGRELARRALEDGARLVVAVGGDGSLGEVVDGFLSAPEESRKHAAVGTFPCGSGCDFARHMRITRDPARWADEFARGGILPTDAIKATFDVDGKPVTRHLLNMAAAGIPGDVALSVARRGKLLGGTLSYLIEGALAAASARPRRMRLVLDGEVEEGEFHLFTAANTSTFGGGMKVAPDADESDGLLDVVTIGAIPNSSLLGLLPRAYSGGHLGRPGVRVRRARRVELSSPEPLVLNLDGDVEGRSPAVFEALPLAIPFWA